MNFVLVPFHASGPIDHKPVGCIGGSIARRGTQLNVEFTSLPRHGIHWPDADAAPERRSGLWQSTCFECFIGLGDADTYIESNLSPSGHWQAFEFEAYREIAVPADSVRVSGRLDMSTGDQSSMNCTIDIEHPRFVTSDWYIAPTAILEDLQGKLHYYALSHPIKRPDFHLSATRTLLLTERDLSLSDLPASDQPPR